MDEETRRLARELALRLAASEAPPKPWGDLWKAYFAAEGILRRSKKNQQSWAKSLGRYFGDEPITKAKGRGYLEWRTAQEGHRKGSTISPSTAGCELRYGRRVLNWAVSEGLLTTNPLTGIKTPPAAKREGSVRGAALMKIVEACSPWLRTLILVAAYTGMRIDLVRRLRWDEIDFETGRIKPTEPDSVSKKRGAPRLLGPAAQALRDHPRFEGSPWVFTSSYEARSRRKLIKPIGYTWVLRKFHEAAREAGVVTVDGDAVLHHLRHGFALEATEAWGWTLKMLMHRGGWTTMRSVERYGAIDRDADEEAQARAEEAIARRAELAVRKGPRGVVGQGESLDDTRLDKDRK